MSKVARDFSGPPSIAAMADKSPVPIFATSPWCQGGRVSHRQARYRRGFCAYWVSGFLDEAVKGGKLHESKAAEKSDYRTWGPRH